MSKTTSDSSLYADLQAALSDLQTLAADERDIAERFVKWRHHRQTTIETVTRLQQKIDGVAVGCNVARGVGAVAGIAALVSTVAGFIMELKGHQESAKRCKEFGKCCAAGSAVTVASSTVLEIGLSQSTINEIKSVLKRDQELTEPLKQWIRLSRRVDSNLEKHFQCNITSEAFPKIIQVVGLCIEAMAAGEGAWKGFKKDLKSWKLTNIEGLTQQAAEKLQYFFERIVKNPKILEPLKKIWEIFTETRHIFDLARLSGMLYCQVYKFLNSGVLSSLLNTAGLGCSHINSSVLRVALETATVAANVVTIILAAKNIEKGKSEYSEALDGVKKALQEENRVVGYYIDKRLQHANLKSEDLLKLSNLRLH